MKNNDKTVNLFGLDVFSKDSTSLLNWLLSEKNRGRRGIFVATPNPEHVVIASGNKIFQQTLQGADVLLPDGYFLVWASRILHKKGIINQELHQTITGVDITHDLLLLAQEKGWRVLVLGGRDYDEYHTLFTNHGPMEFGPQSQIYWLEAYQDVKNQQPVETELIFEKVREIKPDLIFVCFGAPYQELWIARHQASLEKFGVFMMMGVGGAFDYLTHKITRAPQFMRDLHLEWLFRLIRQPWRFWRQLRFIKFLQLVYSSKE